MCLRSGIKSKADGNLHPKPTGCLGTENGHTGLPRKALWSENESSAWGVCPEHKGQLWGFFLFFFPHILNFYQGEIHSITILKWTIKWWLVHSQFCVQPPTLSGSQTFSSPWEQTPYPLGSSPQSAFLQLLKDTNLCSVSLDIPLLDISYKWNHTESDLLYLAPLTSMFLRFIHIIAWISTSFLFMAM